MVELVRAFLGDTTPVAGPAGAMPEGAERVSSDSLNITTKQKGLLEPADHGLTGVQLLSDAYPQLSKE